MIIESKRIILRTWQDEDIRRKKFLCLATNEYVDECITGLLREEFVCN